MKYLWVGLFSVFLVACSSTQYIMSTSDGQLVTAYGKPILDEETGMYKYEDEDGREMYLEKDKVVQIMER
ncbi:YgdI/YgdR family lipoprotein [Corallincola platygyrae]|uniref:YgdI/YgdR family lipoprotein n=1 Tax=Corallincola platygyrae TaxID=1193278 RepID=A0ABW4XJ27_9GAMM